MTAIEPETAQYLLTHPGQAFCRDCLEELTARVQESGDAGEDRPGGVFREFNGTCFQCHKPRHVIRFILK
jgi:hypothetical protein